MILANSLPLTKLSNHVPSCWRAPILRQARHTHGGCSSVQAQASRPRYQDCYSSDHFGATIRFCNEWYYVIIMNVPEQQKIRSAYFSYAFLMYASRCPSIYMRFHRVFVLPGVRFHEPDPAKLWNMWQQLEYIWNPWFNTTCVHRAPNIWVVHIFFILYSFHSVSYVQYLGGPPGNYGFWSMGTPCN